MAQRIRLSRPRRRRARQTTQPGAWWTRVTPASACALVCMALSFFVVVSFLFSHIEIDEDHHDLIFHLSQETASPSRQISPSKPLQTRHEDSASPPAPTRHQPPAFEDAGAEDGGSAAQQGSDAPPVHPALRGPPAPASDAAAAPGPAQQGECAAFVTEEGTDMPGDDMGSDKVQSVDGCCALCTKEGAACKVCRAGVPSSRQWPCGSLSPGHCTPTLTHPGPSPGIRFHPRQRLLLAQVGGGGDRAPRGDHRGKAAQRSPRPAH